jgi:hypothetical protein
VTPARAKRSSAVEALAALTTWARARNLLVKTSRHAGRYRCGVYSPGSIEPLIERAGDSPDGAAFYLINTLGRLGTGPDPWEHA